MPAQDRLGEAEDAGTEDQDGAVEKLRGWKLWESIGSPRFICAPMVDQSELAFRMLCRRYGCTLAYTPMIHSRNFANDAKYRKQNFSTCPTDRPLFAQFCGDDASTLVAAARQIPASEIDGVDLNCGCPQGIARKGHYGSFLLTEKDLLENIVRRMDTELPHPVTVKMRLITGDEDLQQTLNLASTLVAAGASALCVHGRTKEMKGQHTGPCNWDAITAIRRRIGNVPIVANGGLETYEDCLRCLEHTGCAAVMSSEGLLEKPSLFAGPAGSYTTGSLLQEDLSLEYVELAKLYGSSHRQVKAHLFHFMYAGFQLHQDMRPALGSSKTLDEMAVVMNSLKSRLVEGRANKVHWPDSGWYLRYREPLGEKKKRKAPEADTGNTAEVGTATVPETLTKAAKVEVPTSEKELA